MKNGKWIALIVSGGLLLQVGSCLTDFAYAALDAVVDYLPDLMSAWLAAATETV